MIKKNNYKFFIAIFLLIIFNTSVNARINPTFNLTVRNILSHPGATGQDSIITFELWMQQTNQGLPDVNDLEYAAGQFTFRYNKLIHSSGGNLVLGLVPEGCELPAELRPPTFQVDSANGFLKTSGNLPQSLINYFISGTYPGSKILTLKIRTNRKAFNMVPLNLKFKLGTSPNSVLAYFLPYPPSVDSTLFPFQQAVILTDTIVNHYWVEDSSAVMPIFLSNPAHNSSSVLRHTNFSWCGSNGAQTYKLQISDDENFNNIVFTDSSLVDTFKTVNSLNPNTSYYWKVSGKNDSAYFTISDVWIFNTGGIQVLLSKPSDSASYVPLPVIFTWHKTSQVTSLIPEILAYEMSDNLLFKKILNTDEKTKSNVLVTDFDFPSGTMYKLEIAEDQNFNNIVFIDSAADSIRTVTNLNLNKNYYWKVTPTNDSLFVVTSNIWSFNTYVAPVMLSNPANNFESVSPPVNFLWFKRDNAVSYKLLVSSDQNFYNIVINDSSITDTFKTVSNLDFEKRYYWKVSAKNDSEYFSVSQTWNFTTQAILISPANNSFNIPSTVDFLWHKIDSTVNYVLQVSTDPNFNSFIVNDSSLTDTFKTVSGLNNSTNYYWRVKVKNSSNNFLISNVWIFRTLGSGYVYTIHININGLQEVPPNLSTAFGTMDGTYNDETRTLAFDISFTNLTGASIAANLHGPAPSGINAPVQIELNGFPSGVTAGTYSNSYILNEQQGDEILAGYWYVNIQSTAFPEGEIRGQLNEGGSLPVELSGFTSNIIRDKVTLNWSTSSEFNNAGFDVERSKVKSETSDDWIKIGFVEGEGTTSLPENYSFTENINSGKYKYRLKQIDHNGNFQYYHLENDVEIGIPDKYNLSQNYPNPFNPATKIDFEIPYDGKISLIVYDISGREIANLVNEFRTAGYYTVDFNASNLASGIYFYMMKGKDFQVTKKMVVLK